MRDRDARAGIALKFIYKAGNAKYYHPTHNFYSSLFSILSKNCFKELFVYPPFEYIDRGIWAIASPKANDQGNRKPQSYRVQSASSLSCQSDWSKCKSLWGFQSFWAAVLAERNVTRTQSNSFSTSCSIPCLLFKLGFVINEQNLLGPKHYRQNCCTKGGRNGALQFVS